MQRCIAECVLFPYAKESFNKLLSRNPGPVPEDLRGGPSRGDHSSGVTIKIKNAHSSQGRSVKIDIIFLSRQSVTEMEKRRQENRMRTCEPAGKRATVFSHLGSMSAKASDSTSL